MDKTFFSDEAVFHLIGEVYKQYTSLIIFIL
jgi:hypothetical protein